MGGVVKEMSGWMRKKEMMGREGDNERGRGKVDDKRGGERR